MIVKKFPKPLTKKFLRRAAVYRRFAERSVLYDFSLEMLIECFNNETHGHPTSKKNGYSYGKWMKDIAVVTWREDIQNGYFCKAEFYTPCNKWWAEPALASVPSVAWFPFEANEKSHILSILK